MNPTNRLFQPPFPMKTTRLSLTAFLILAACATGSRTDESATVGPPMPMQGKAYDAAARVELPRIEAQHWQGLHNVYRLSEDIVSGSEPEGEVAFAKLEGLGIKTILSVDGKAPDADLAGKHGMRYVHVPIRYRGITEREKLEIAKTFRELEAPFYVHCFHGKHRGPAAAALGRVILDGVGRDRAIAEMRQYSGTSGKYEGLYATIAFGRMPDDQAIAACDFDFAPAHRFQGFRQAMIEISRSFGTTAKLSKNSWMATEDHPDANAANEANRTAETFAEAQKLDEMVSRSEDFRKRMQVSTEDATVLAGLLARQAQGDEAAGKEAKTVLQKLKTDCKSCHTRYRNAGY